MGHNVKSNHPEKPRSLFIARLMLLTGLVSLLFWPMMAANAAPTAQENLPTYGWVVAEDLEVGEVPGLPNAQRFRMRHQDTWELLAYCLEPSIDPPPEGTTCQLIDEDTFWCGAGLQHLRVYQILQTPPPPSPTPSFTPTSTASATAIPTSTATSTPSPTATPTSTSTSIPTQTQTPTPTPSTTPKPTEAATQAQENKPTPTPRSRSGQSGQSDRREIVQKGEIVRWSLGSVFIGIAAGLAVYEWRQYLRSKKQ